jgi:hypothetical protein
MTKKPMKFKRYEEGGDVEESKAKERGLEMSNKEAPIGFLQRLRMGNIDDPNSEAYKRFGAGRGRLEAPAKKEEPAPTRAMEPTPVARPSMKPNPIFAAGEEQGKRQPSGDASVAEFYANRPRNPEAEQEADNPRKTAPKPTVSKPTTLKPAAPKPTAKNPEAEQEADNPKKTTPIDVTKLSLAERRKLNSTKSSPTDKRSVNERIREKFGFNKGGSVSSASKRADGIATKGKTRGKIC